jgi:hypothetical protein
MTIESLQRSNLPVAAQRRERRPMRSKQTDGGGANGCPASPDYTRARRSITSGRLEKTALSRRWGRGG